MIRADLMEEERESSDPAKKLILVVEDDESMLDLTQSLVKSEGFRVEEARDGAQALKCAESGPPDLIVLDLMLPGVAGYEVIRSLQVAGLGHIPVIVMTARRFDEMTIDSLRSEPNVREVFPKPLPQARFAALLHVTLGTFPIGDRVEWEN